MQQIKILPAAKFCLFCGKQMQTEQINEQYKSAEIKSVLICYLSICTFRRIMT